MKRKSFGAVKFGIFAVAAVGVSCAAGYYFMSPHSLSTAPQTSNEAPSPTASVESVPNAAPVQPRPVADAGKYTAPGAPTVMIAEIKSSPVPEKTEADPEESQTGVAPQAAATAPDSSQSTAPTPVGTNTDTDDTDSNGAPASTLTSDSSSAAPPDPQPAAPTNSPAVAPQAAPPPAPVAAPAPTVTGPLFCVEAGTFATEKNAKTLVDNLKTLGYGAAVVPADSAGDSFRVQVGAYSSKPTADSTVGNLQRQGYPAYILTK